jgi:hypothetical protein
LSFLTLCQKTLRGRSLRKRYVKDTGQRGNRYSTQDVNEMSS